MRGPALAIVLSLVALGAAACADEEATAVNDGAGEELKEGSLGVDATTTLPIGEVSGLGRRRIGGNAQYLAVSDSSPLLVTFDVGPRGGVSNVATHDLSPLIGSGAPQWEAVAGDGAGNVFVLAEAADRITVFDSALRAVKHTFEISIPSSHPLSSAWKKDANSRGEGMLLLANGHVLLVKEKDPVAILELAPSGAEAEGYSAELALRDATFRLPPSAGGASSKLVPVHHWLLKDSQTKLAKDVSELAVDVDGRLLLLSDQDRVLVRVERGLRPDEDKVDLKAVFTLPGSVDKPEGLVLADGVPFVAIDAKNPGETLFRMGRLP